MIQPIVPVGTDADTNEKTLFTYTLPANSLATNNHGIKILAWGTTAANANTKQVKVKFGSVTIYDSTAIASNDNPWMYETEIYRTGASAQDFLQKFGVFNAVAILPGFVSTLAEDLTANVVIEVTGQNGTGTANDIVAQGWRVDYIS